MTPNVAVCAAGTLRTPGLLARSGHRASAPRQALYSASGCRGDRGEFDRPIEPWNGPMQSAYSDAFNYRAGNYGAKIEVAPVTPGLSPRWRCRGSAAADMPV